MAAVPREGGDAHLPVASTSPRWRRLDQLAILAFAVLLPLPALAMGLGVRPQAIENRPLLTPPPFSPGALGQAEWYSALDRFIADNVAMRPQAVRLRAKVDVAFNGSPSPDVIRGVDEWLFYRDELSATCTLAGSEMIAGLDAAATGLSAAGQEFRFVLAPDKHVFYPDKRRPDDAIPPPCTDARRAAVRAAIGARAAFAIDGWAAVERARAANPGADLYFHQDSHWTPVAAMAEISDLVTSFDPSLWSEADIVAGEPKPVQMDLAQILGIPQVEMAIDPRVRPGVTLTQVPVDHPEGTRLPYPILRYTASGDRPLLAGRTVMAYDSYFGRHIPQISPFFADVTWVHIDDLKQNPDAVRRLGSFDRVVFQEVERYLYRVRIDALIQPLVRPRS